MVVLLNAKCLIGITYLKPHQKQRVPVEPGKYISN